MGDLNHELNRQAATKRLAALAARGAPVSIRPIEGGPEMGPWLRRAMGAVALTVASAASMAAVAPPASLPAHSPALAAAMQLGTVSVVVGGKAFETLHPMERVRLCKEVASEQRLSGHGLDWRDLYAVVQAETGWASRDGMGLNGKASFGLAQMEGATAEALGIDPHDPKQALAGVARLLKEAGAWAKAKGLSNRKAALSVYYNLSTRARNEWDGDSIDTLPRPTQQHIHNVQDGRRIATALAPRYEKFVMKAREALQSQEAIRADLAQQKTHLAGISAFGFGDVFKANAHGGNLRAKDLLSGQANNIASLAGDRASVTESMSVRLRMQGFPGSALRPSEDMARRIANQSRQDLQSQGLGKLTESLRYAGEAAAQVIASAKSRLVSQPQVANRNPIGTEFPALARVAVALGLPDVANTVSVHEITEGQPGEHAHERSMTANNRLAQDPENQMIKDATVMTAARGVLREQQAALAEALHRLAAHATSSGVQYALNEQGRMVAAAAAARPQRLVHA